MRFGVPELLVVLLIIILLFGTKKLRNMGGDLGGMLRDFRKAFDSRDETNEKTPADNSKNAGIQSPQDKKD